MPAEFSGGWGLSKKDANIAAKRMKWMIAQGIPCTENNFVADAKSPSSPLHHMFPWNDRQAAIKFRLIRAAEIIRHVTVTILNKDGTAFMDKNGKPLRARAFVKVMNIGGGKSFEPLGKVLATPVLRSQIEDEAKRAIDRWIRTYQRYVFLRKFVREIQAAYKRL